MALRRLRLTGQRIAHEIGVSSDGKPDPARGGLRPSRPANFEPAKPVVRYEREQPGEMIHIDVKKLGRFERRPPHYR